MRITQELYDAMIKHARRDLPDECCGLVECVDDEAVATYPIRNIRPTATSFLADPVEVAQVLERMHDAGHQLGALYHSHPSIPPVPSMIDVRDAADWSGVMWIIIGNLEPRFSRHRRWIKPWDEEPDEEPDVWAWWIEGGQIFTAELTITKGGAEYDPEDTEANLERNPHWPHG